LFLSKRRLRSTNQINLASTNLFLATNLVIRAGDALLLARCRPPPPTARWRIVISGVTNYTSPAVCQSLTAHDAGVFTLIGTYISASGQSLSRTVSVNVITAALGANPRRGRANCAHGKPR